MALLLNDKGVMAWIIVGAYALTFLLTLAATRQTAAERDGWFWAITTLGMLLLGLNKQLDLQTQFTAMLREMARADGWYENRRSLQMLFDLVLGIALVTALVFILLLTRKSGIGVRLALIGLASLSAFIMLRAASFHHVDVVLSGTIAGIKLHALLELSGILLVATGAFAALATPPPPRKR